MLWGMGMQIIRHPGLLPGLVLCTAAAQAGDWPDPGAMADSAGVNEGELAFIADVPERRVLQTRNHLTILPTSLAGGWVSLEQCQGNLDPVAAVEIVYRYHGMRGLRIVSASGMESAVLDGNSVQLTGVRHGGEVCIRAEVQVLKPDGAGGYRLQSGPFHRRFLDGYYPLRLDYRVEWPADRLALEAVSPGAQPGFRITGAPGALQIDTLFEGRLTIELQFETVK
jgi:hypothetical protein